MEVFKKHLEIVKNSKYNFLNPNEFDSKFKTSKSEKEVLITIDDAFESFYYEAWPHLRDNRIPFILFVSTEPVGNKGYIYEGCSEPRANTAPCVAIQHLLNAHAGRCVFVRCAVVLVCSLQMLANANGCFCRHQRHILSVPRVF